MGKKKLLAAIAVAAILTGGWHASCSRGEGSADMPEKEMGELLHVIDNAATYQRGRLLSLDSLRQAAQRPADSAAAWQAACRLSEEYRQMNSDSALKYARQAISLAPGSGRSDADARSRLAMVDALSSAGLFSVALKTLDSLSQTPMGADTRIELWRTGRTCYAYLAQYTVEDPGLHELYRRRSMEYDDSLMKALPAGDSFARFLRGERLVDQGRYAQARIALDSLMADLPEHSRLYAMSAYQLAEVFRNQGNEKMYAANLAKSAMGDIYNCTNEGLSLPALANWLYTHGEIDCAFRFINHAMDISNQGNLRMRMTTTGMLAPVIDEAYRDQIDTSTRFLRICIIIATLLLVACAALSAFLILQVRKVHASQRKLQAVDRVKDSYIANFIGLCSSYASRLDHLTNSVTRKIEAGKTDELLKSLNNGKVPEQDDDKLYETFDRTLLDIFPDFVDSINSLLRPEKKIVVEKPGTLTPELRIHAFVRLGIDESARIAQILRYSTSTVYNYRTKMRNKAIDRDNFDENVRNLGR